MKGLHAHSASEAKGFEAAGMQFAGHDHNGNPFFAHTAKEAVLSSMENQVYSMKSLKDNEIAQRLNISEKSVSAYRQKIKAKGF